MTSLVLVGIGLGMALWHGIACVLTGFALAGMVPGWVVRGMISVSAWAALAGLAAPITLLVKYGQPHDAAFYGLLATIWPGTQLLYDECLLRAPWARRLFTVTFRSLLAWTLVGLSATVALYGAALRLIASTQAP